MPIRPHLGAGREGKTMDTCNHGWVSTQHDPAGHYLHICLHPRGHAGLHECDSCGDVHR